MFHSPPSFSLFCCLGFAAFFFLNIIFQQQPPISASAFCAKLVLQIDFKGFF